jgi:hypothetical protein
LIGKDNEVISIASSHEEDLGTISEMSVSEDGTGDRKTLASWLRKSKDKLTSMFHRAQTKLKITRGRYYRKGVDEPSLRTKQHHAQQARAHDEHVLRVYSTSSPLLEFFKRRPRDDTTKRGGE